MLEVHLGDPDLVLSLHIVELLLMHLSQRHDVLLFGDNLFLPLLDFLSQPGFVLQTLLVHLCLELAHLVLVRV